MEQSRSQLSRELSTVLEIKVMAAAPLGQAAMSTQSSSQEDGARRQRREKYSRPPPQVSTVESSAN